MAGDDRFRLMFFEEARELLISLEEGLLELERRQGDRAHLDRVFRAAHSLKGAAAMVGLAPIAEFTHGIEAVLEKVRSGDLGVDPDLISTLLEARDHLAAMVESEAANAPIPAPADLNKRIATLLKDGRVQDAEPPPAPSPEPPTRPAPKPPPPPTVENTPAAKPKTKSRSKKSGEEGAAKAKPRRSRAKKAKSETPQANPDPEAVPEGFYLIHLKPGPDLLKRGINPLGILDELREMGPTVVSCDPGEVPTLDELDPERCFLSWEIRVETNEPPDRLDDVFLFLGEDTKVTVDRRTADGEIESHEPPHLMEAVTPPPAPPPVAAREAPNPEPAAKSGTAQASAPSKTTPPAASPSKAAPPGTPPPPTSRAAAGAPPPPPPPSQGAVVRLTPRIRVDAHQLDDLVGLAGELAVLSDNLQGLREIPGAFAWVHTLEALERVSRQIRDTTLDLRMVPVDELFSRFPRVVRDLADRFGKEIELRINGQETRLDRTIVERLGDPMIHLIRNAVDHALESPDDRVARGKPRRGKITLSAGHEGDRVAIRVEDDGRGLDRERIVRRGIDRGLVPFGTSPDDPRVDTLIFEPGFSTRDEVSDLSGRGVGLDVVRDAVRGLRGSLAVESMPGKGTQFVFRLPLTLALIDGLLVETGGCRYVVPLAQVEECVALNGTLPALSKGRPCVAVRGELVPTVGLRRLFRVDGPMPARQELLLTRHAGQRVGVAVDKLLGRVQAVIQALGEGLVGLNRFSGATILGDGSVSLILDLAALVSESRAADQKNHGTPPAGLALGQDLG